MFLLTFSLVGLVFNVTFDADGTRLTLPKEALFTDIHLTMSLAVSTMVLRFTTVL